MLLSFQNGLENIMHLSIFLGVPCDETFAEIVLDASCFENVKEKKKDIYPIEFYRKGKIFITSCRIHTL
jgi:hypothetical protein